MFDQEPDQVRYNLQGNLFTTFPDVTQNPTYVPIVAEVGVISSGEPCQDIKSEEGVVARTDVKIAKIVPPPANTDGTATGAPDGRYLAWAMIDPSADVLFPDTFAICQAQADPTVCHDPQTNLGPQRLGWMDHYLVAYIDGGYLPTTARQDPTADGLTANVIAADAQILYVPNTSDVGMGNDVLSRKRGEAGYSPLCHIETFSPADPSNLPTDAAQIDPTSLDPEPTPARYVYCLQVAE